MVAVFARPVVVNGVKQAAGDPVEGSGLTEIRYKQMVNLKRIIDSEDPSAKIILPRKGSRPLFAADRHMNVTDVIPVSVTPADVEPSAGPDSATETVEGMDADGLWPCRVENCDRRLGNERGRTNHENREH